jgi:ribosome-binding protein aMBF1 (putative translation factor)
MALGLSQNCAPIFSHVSIAGSFDGASSMGLPNHDLYRRALALLARARKAHCMTSADLAAKLGFAEDFVAQYEAGHWRLDPAEYIFVARAVGVDPYELLAQAEDEVG